MPSAYVTLDEATTYFNTKLNNRVWLNSDQTKRQNSLYEATKLIDVLNFAGKKTSPTQPLEFPRSGIGSFLFTAIPDTVVPQRIQDACCEIAYELLDGFDPNIEASNLTMSHFSYGQMKATKEVGAVLEHRVHGIPSMLAWTWLKPFLRDQGSLNLVRVS
jgi:hypothetical protein